MQRDPCASLGGAAKRIQLYCGAAARALLRAFAAAGAHLTAAQAARAAGLGEGEARGALEALLSSGLLKVVSVSYGASSGSGESTFRALLKCPYCGSPDISREEIAEHVKCGYIGRLSEFEEGGRLRCPRCGLAVGEGELRTIGIWYSCRSCGRSFPRPNLSLVGADDGKEYSVDDLLPFREPVYALADGAAEEVRAAVELLDSLEAMLRERGYSPSGPTKFRGRSGVEHSFCLSASGPGGQRILIDILICGADSADVLRAVTKAFDVAQDAAAYVLVAPEVRDPALQMASAIAAQGLRLKVVAAPSPSELPEALGRSL